MRPPRAAGKSFLRRSRFVFLRIEDRRQFDFRELLQGTIGVESRIVVCAESVIQGESYPLTDDEIRILRHVPGDGWMDQRALERRLGVSRKLVESMKEKGLVVSSSRKKSLQILRQREETLADQAWNPYSALYHFATKWKDVRTGASWPMESDAFQRARLYADSAVERISTRFGPPPPPFYSAPRARGRIRLEKSTWEGETVRLLRQRRTSRNFDGRRSISKEQLETLLESTFGCYGYQTTANGSITWLKKTSPSGGALHPTEAYPLVLNVRGIAPGLYHYRVQDHSLDLLEPLAPRRARDLASCFTAGQDYARRAGVLFVMASRFYRNFWKYRRHAKSYKVLLMDVAHLSQTFYLVSAALGLGAFFTAAINGANAEERLGLDPYQQGVLAICGCGVVKDRGPTLDFDPIPYVPGRTRI